MHSSRIRTARLLPVSPSMRCFGGGVPAGGVLAQGVYLPGGYLPGGTCPEWGGVYLPGGGGGVPVQVLPHCEQNDWQTGVKHNLRKLRLRAVKIKFWSLFYGNSPIACSFTNQCVQKKDPRLSASNRQLIHNDVQFGSAYCGPSNAISLKIT